VDVILDNLGGNYVDVMDFHWYGIMPGLGIRGIRGHNTDFLAFATHF